MRRIRPPIREETSFTRSPFPSQNIHGLPMKRGCRSRIASAADVSGTARTLSPLPCSTVIMRSGD
jgi:hypothetical protein